MNEYGELVVGEHGSVLLKGVGVDEHLQALVLSEVYGVGFVHGLCLTLLQVVDGHV